MTHFKHEGSWHIHKAVFIYNILEVKWQYIYSACMSLTSFYVKPIQKLTQKHFQFHFDFCKKPSVYLFEKH